MEEQKSVEQSKNGIKSVFWQTLNQAACDLIRHTINARTLGVAIAIWFLLSLTASSIRRIYDRCNIKMPVGKYLMIDEFCEIK